MTAATSPRNLTAIVLAAGQGTRMKSSRPKVLHELCGRPMVHHVVQTALDAGAGDVIVVVGFGRDEVAAELGRAFGDRVRTATQEVQRGTGHAVQCALPALRPDAGLAFVLYGDTPLLEQGELESLAAAIGDRPLAMLTCVTPDPA